MTDGTPGDLARYRVATIPGDGVGPEVVEAARRVVSAAGNRFGFTVDWSTHIVQYTTFLPQPLTPTMY